MVKINNGYLCDKNVNQIVEIKKQIILINTNSTIDEYLNKITLRYNKKYDKIPAYTIDSCGKIYQHYDPLFSSRIFNNDSLNKQAIVIALENIGWLKYDKETDTYRDWKGTQYHDKIIEIPWRTKKYWSEYSNEQLMSLIDLIDYLCIGYSINKKFIGDNLFDKEISSFKGIINRSNINKNYYDLTPAFNFNELTKIINT